MSEEANVQCSGAPLLCGELHVELAHGDVLALLLSVPCFQLLISHVLAWCLLLGEWTAATLFSSCRAVPLVNT